MAARGGRAVRKDTGPPLRSEGTEATSFGREPGVCPRTVPPPGNAVASGLHPGLAELQPRRRDRFPKEVVSEGAPQQSPFRHAETAPSRQSDGRFSCHGPPSRADEGGVPDAGAGWPENPPSQPRFAPAEKLDSFLTMPLIEGAAKSATAGGCSPLVESSAPSGHP